MASTRKKLAWAGGIVALLVMAALLVLPQVIDANSFRPFIEKTARDKVGREVEVGELQAALLPFPSVRIARLVVPGEAGAPAVLETGTVHLRASLLPLIFGDLVVSGVTLDDARIHVRRDAQGTWDFMQLVPARGGPKGTAALVVQGVELRRARVRIEDAYVLQGSVVRHELTDVEASVSGLNEPERGFDVRVACLLPSAGGASVSWKGQVGPGRSLDGSAEALGLELERVGPYLARLFGLADLAGKVDVRVKALRTADGTLSAEGDAVVAGFTSPFALRGSAPLTARTSFRVGVEPNGRLKIEETRLETGATRLEVSAEVVPDGDSQVITASLAETSIVPGDLARLLAAAGQDLPAAVLGPQAIRLGGRARLVRRRPKVGQSFAIESVSLDGIRLAGARVDVRRTPDGKYEFPALAARAQRARAGAALPALAVRDVVVKDTALRLSDGDAVLLISGVELSLGAWSTGRPADLDVRAVVQGGALAARGRVGSSAQGGAQLDLDVDLVGVPTDALLPWIAQNLPVSGGTASVKTKLVGSLSSELAATGTLALRGATVGASGRTAGPLDLDVTHDVVLEGEGRRITLRRLDVVLPAARLALDGRVEIMPDGPLRFDIGTREAVQVSSRDLVLLSALASGRMPFDLTAEDPLEVNVRLKRGPSGRLTAEGRARVSRLAVRHRLLQEALLVAKADVTLSGETVSVRDLALRLGASDLAGDLEMEGFESHRVRFDLTSQQADLDELFAFLGGARQESAPAAADPNAPDHLGLTSASGRLTVARATLGGLELQDFAADVQFASRVLTIDPVGLALYGGVGRGQVRVDLRPTAPAFSVRTDLEDVRVKDLLVAGVGYDQLAGTGAASFTLDGTASSATAALGTVQGGGNFRIATGEFKGLNVLATLEKAEVFGENSLSKLGQRLAAEGTTFTEATGEHRLAGGTLTLSKLRVDSPDALVTAAGTVGLLDQRLNLDGQVLFSAALSEAMQAEGSKAARLFWDDRSGRVLLPVRLVGTIAAPEAKIDWTAAATRAGQRELLREVSKRTGGLVDSLFGGGKGGSTGGTSTPAPGPADGGAQAPPAKSELGSGAGPAPGGLAARIETARQAGSLLAPDIKVKAVLSGEDLSHGVLVLKDSAGRELLRRDPVWRSDIETAAAGGTGFLEVPVSLTIGNSLVRSSGDLTVEVTAVDRSGRTSAVARASVQKKSLF